MLILPIRITQRGIRVRHIRTIRIFIISLIVSYLIVGYAKSTMFVWIHWTEEATVFDKLKEYYIRTFSINIIPSIILALIATLIIIDIYKKKLKIK